MEKKLHYCEKKTGNSKKCSSLAKYKVTLQGEKGNFLNYRCECHKHSSTQSKKVVSFEEINQTLQLYEVNKFLEGLIGKDFFSRHHGTTLKGLYLKPNGVIMSVSQYGKFKAVYYYQIQKL